jgi:hypothetical protein
VTDKPPSHPQEPRGMEPDDPEERERFRAEREAAEKQQQAADPKEQAKRAAEEPPHRP